MKKVLLLVAIATMLCSQSFGQFRKAYANGSGGIVRTSRYTKSTTTFWTYFDATKRASLVNVTTNGKVRVLVENPPDAAFSTTQSVLTALKLGTGSLSISAENKVDLAKQVVLLGQRTAVVNILRDAMYRLNESYYNTLCLDCCNDYTPITDSIKTSPRYSGDCTSALVRVLTNQAK